MMRMMIMMTRPSLVLQYAFLALCFWTPQYTHYRHTKHSGRSSYLTCTPIQHGRLFLMLKSGYCTSIYNLLSGEGGVSMIAFDWFFGCLRKNRVVSPQNKPTRRRVSPALPAGRTIHKIIPSTLYLVPVRMGYVSYKNYVRKSVRRRLPQQTHNIINMAKRRIRTRRPHPNRQNLPQFGTF
jgi:hypothetical protein